MSDFEKVNERIFGNDQTIRKRGNLRGTEHRREQQRMNRVIINAEEERAGWNVNKQRKPEGASATIKNMNENEKLKFEYANAKKIPEEYAETLETKLAKERKRYGFVDDVDQVQSDKFGYDRKGKSRVDFNIEKENERLNKILHEKIPEGYKDKKEEWIKMKKEEAGFVNENQNTIYERTGARYAADTAYAAGTWVKDSVVQIGASLLGALTYVPYVVGGVAAGYVGCKSAGWYCQDKNNAFCRTAMGACGLVGLANDPPKTVINNYYNREPIQNAMPEELSGYQTMNPYYAPQAIDDELEPIYADEQSFRLQQSMAKPRFNKLSKRQRKKLRKKMQKNKYNNYEN